MKHLKLYSLVFILFLFLGCAKYVSIIEASKTMNVSGLLKGKDYIDYKLEIDVKKKIAFKSIALDGSKVIKGVFIKLCILLITNCLTNESLICFNIL